MRSNRFFLIGMILIMFIIGLIPPSSATKTQWYPDVGTTVDYSVIHYLSFKNGAETVCNEFYLYNYTGTTYYAIPTVLRLYFSPISWPGTIIASDTQLTIRHTYSNQSATQLRKTVTIIWDGGSIAVNGKSFYLFLIENTSYQNIFITYTSNSILPKEGFPPFTLTTYLHDYINASAGLFEPTPYLVPNIMLSPNYIIAKLELLGLVGFNINLTLIANGGGKVLTCGYTARTPEIDSLGLRCAAYTFEVIGAIGAIPAFPLIWTLIGLVSSIFFITNLSKRRKIKLKGAVF